MENKLLPSAKADFPSWGGDVDYSLPRNQFCKVLDKTVQRHTSKLCSQSESLLMQNQILFGVILQT